MPNSIRFLEPTPNRKVQTAKATADTQIAVQAYPVNSAKVQISYQDGTSKLATVSSVYDPKNDWINLRAYGFTYSTPQLAISFKMPKQTPKIVEPKKATITCMKGKSSKKVSGIKPKCPSGYKKK